MSNTAILKKLGMVPYKTLPFLTNGKRQTITAVYFPYNPFISNEHQHIVPLPDGDNIVLVENSPTNWTSSQRIILLVHGLTGSHQSRYLIRSTHKFTQAGFKVFRMNLRGCGAGVGLAKHLYHSGRSEDTRAVLYWLKQQYPQSPVTQIGFSLGGNITLKMAGEDGGHPSGNLDSLAAVSPPLDLESSVNLIIKKRNKLFNNYFVAGLLRDTKILHQHFPELTFPVFPKNLNVYQFDDLYTAPRSGFANAKDYYTKCSSGNFVDNITIPTFILYAKDDPVITRRSFLKLPHKSNFDTLITKKGGHVAWLGYTDHQLDYRWMDNIIVKWVKWFDSEAS